MHTSSNNVGLMKNVDMVLIFEYLLRINSTSVYICIILNLSYVFISSEPFKKKWSKDVLARIAACLILLFTHDDIFHVIKKQRIIICLRNLGIF